MLTHEKVDLDEAGRKVDEALDKTLALIKKSNGGEIDMSEWLTISNYSKKYSIPQSTITTWISRGVIPAECVENFPELNNIKLIKDQPYK